MNTAVTFFFFSSQGTLNTLVSQDSLLINQVYHFSYHFSDFFLAQDSFTILSLIMGNNILKFSNTSSFQYEPSIQFNFSELLRLLLLKVNKTWELFHRFSLVAFKFKRYNKFSELCNKVLVILRQGLYV